MNENSNLFINPQANMEEANICDDISDAFQINNDFTPDYQDVPNSNSVNDDANSTFNAQTNAEEANDIEENPEIIDIENDLPPDYQDVIDSGLPDYHSLKNWKMIISGKIFIMWSMNLILQIEELYLVILEMKTISMCYNLSRYFAHLNKMIRA